MIATDTARILKEYAEEQAELLLCLQAGLGAKATLQDAIALASAAQLIATYRGWSTERSVLMKEELEVGIMKLEEAFRSEPVVASPTTPAATGLLARAPPEAWKAKALDWLLNRHATTQEYARLCASLGLQRGSGQTLVDKARGMGVAELFEAFEEARVRL